MSCCPDSCVASPLLPHFSCWETPVSVTAMDTPHSGLCKEECPLCFPPAQLLPSKTLMHHWTEGSGLMEVLTGTCSWKAQHGGPTSAASPQLRVQAQSPLDFPKANCSASPLASKDTVPQGDTLTLIPTSRPGEGNHNKDLSRLSLKEGLLPSE